MKMHPLLLGVAFIVCSVSEAFQIPSLARGIQRKHLEKQSSFALSGRSALGMATWSNGQAIKEYQGMFTIAFYLSMLQLSHISPVFV